MAKKETVKLTASQKSMGLAMDNLAAQYATTVAPAIQGDVDRLIAAKQDWEGGKFTVMFRLTSSMTEEQLEALPDTNAKDGNNPAHYHSAIISDGKEKVREHYFYEEMVRSFPAIRAKGTRIDQLKRSMQDPAKVNQTDIGDDIRNMTPDYRNAEITRLQNEITSAVGAVTGAFELYFQFKRFASLKHVEAYPIYRIGPDGSILDGEEGRERSIENTRTPIVMKSTVRGREAIDVVRIGIGTFLRYDVEKAKENHGTYQAVIDTVKREKKGDEKTSNANNQSATQLVRTADTAMARFLDLYEYADYSWEEKDGAQMDALRKKTHGAGSDDAFTAAHGLYRFLRDIVGTPRDEARYQDLIGKEDEEKAA